MKKKNIEVELRALVKDFKSLEGTLKKIGATHHGQSLLHDIYFCKKSITTIKEAEMDDVGSYSIRLRRYSNNNNESITLNTKTITNYGDHHAWEEHEAEVSDFTEAAKMLLVTEFKPFFELKKTRHEYRLEEFGIFLEDIEDFGGAVEVEIITSPGDEESAKQKIMQLFDKLGISESDILPKSVTNIVMKQRAFITEVKL